MNTKLIIACILIFSFVILFGSYYVLSTPAKSEPKILSYSSADTLRPVAEVTETYKDLGKISVSDTTKTTFTVKNTGNKPLQLSKINSSCGCTAGQIVYNGKTSKEYGMHSKSTEVFEIAPGTQALVNVIYRPFTMPVYGAVEREVYINTNDPTNSKIVFKVKATVN